MIKVNLVPADILAKAQQRQRLLQIGLACGAAVLVIAVISMGFWLHLQRLQARLKADKAHYEDLKKVVKIVEDDKSQKAELEKRLGVIVGLDRGRRTYPYFMSDFVRSVPESVRVLTLNTSGGGGSALKLTMTAEARSTDDIALWIHTLEGLGKFSNIEMGAVNAKESPDGTMQGFSLTTVYTPQL
jgi:type IV pilus assembly protein PilN